MQVKQVYRLNDGQQNIKINLKRKKTSVKKTASILTYIPIIKMQTVYYKINKFYQIFYSGLFFFQSENVPKLTNFE